MQSIEVFAKLLVLPFGKALVKYGSVRTVVVLNLSTFSVRGEPFGNPQESPVEPHTCFLQTPHVIHFNKDATAILDILSPCFIPKLIDQEL